MPERLDFIEYGTTEGQYFTEWRFTELGYLARELREIIPGATGWTIWYNRTQDFHHLEFDLEGRHYVVQLYKVFVIYFDDHDTYSGPFSKKNYGYQDDGILDLFRSGRYKTWEDKRGFP